MKIKGLMLAFLLASGTVIPTYSMQQSNGSNRTAYLMIFLVAAGCLASALYFLNIYNINNTINDPLDLQLCEELGEEFFTEEYSRVRGRVFLGQPTERQTSVNYASNITGKNVIIDTNGGSITGPNLNVFNNIKGGNTVHITTKNLKVTSTTGNKGRRPYQSVTPPPALVKNNDARTQEKVLSNEYLNCIGMNNEVNTIKIIGNNLKVEWCDDKNYRDGEIGFEGCSNVISMLDSIVGYEVQGNCFVITQKENVKWDKDTFITIKVCRLSGIINLMAYVYTLHWGSIVSDKEIVFDINVKADSRLGSITTTDNVTIFAHGEGKLIIAPIDARYMRYVSKEHNSVITVIDSVAAKKALLETDGKNRVKVDNVAITEILAFKGRKESMLELLKGSFEKGSSFVIKVLDDARCDAKKIIGDKAKVYSSTPQMSYIGTMNKILSAVISHQGNVYYAGNPVMPEDGKLKTTSSGKLLRFSNGTIATLE